MKEMWSQKRIRLICFVVILTVFSVGCQPESVVVEVTKPTIPIAAYIEPEVPPDFDDFAENVFVELVSLEQSLLDTLLREPEAYGIKVAETNWGNYSKEATEKGWVYLESVVGELERFDYGTLSRGQKITYDQLKTYIDRELSMKEFSHFYDPLSPYDGEHLYFENTLIEHRMKNASDMDAYLLLLVGLEPFVKSLCEYEYARAEKGLFMNEECAEMVLDDCNYVINTEGEKYISIFTDKLSELEGVSDSDKEIYEKTNLKYVKQYVVPSFQLIYDTITDLKGSGTEGIGLTRYEGGKEYYTYLAQKRSGSSMTVDEMFQALEDVLIQNEEEIFRLIMDVDMDRIEEPFEKFETANSVIRNNLLSMSEYFPELYDSPKEYYTVNFLSENYDEDVLGFYCIPQIDNPWDNTIYIAQDAATGYYLYQTTSHETIPGHLYQTVYFLTAPAENIPLRYLLSTYGDGLGTQEGWTKYIEGISKEMAGMPEIEARCLNLIEQFELSWYTILDIGINYYGWTKKDAIAYFRDKDLKDIFKVTDEMILEMDAAPTRLLPYSIGLYEVQIMKKRAEEMLGSDFLLIEFHRFYLETGPCTFDIMNRELDQWIEDYLDK